jgi:prophage DNA circulation protein
MAAGDRWNIINDLPTLTWRGIEAPPYDMASLSGSFSLAERRFPYIDGATHDDVGRNPIPMGFQLHFINTLGVELFPELFDRWVRAVITDGSAGDLEHPILGLVSARPAKWDLELTSKRTAGVVMTVNFIETIVDPSTDDADFGGIILDAKAAAEAVDQDYSKLKLKWPDGARTDDLTQLVAQVDGLITSTSRTAFGAVTRATGFVGGLIEDVDSIGNNLTYGLRDNLIGVWTSLKNIEEQLGVKEERTVGETVFIETVGLDEAASEVGNTVGELMALNSNLLGKPTIPGGTTVKYYVT